MLKPILSKPCSDCPFRTDRPGFLGQGRAEEIAQSLVEGKSFTCHKTNEFGENGQGIVTQDSRHCAGAAAVLLAERQPNQCLQVAQRLAQNGIVEYQEPDTEHAFGSMEEFIKHHSFNRR